MVLGDSIGVSCLVLHKGFELVFKLQVQKPCYHLTYTALAVERDWLSVILRAVKYYQFKFYLVYYLAWVFKAMPCHHPVSFQDIFLQFLF